jgi:hypothetical protein
MTYSTLIEALLAHAPLRLSAVNTTALSLALPPNTALPATTPTALLRDGKLLAVPFASVGGFSIVALPTPVGYGSGGEIHGFGLVYCPPSHPWEQLPPVLAAVEWLTKNGVAKPFEKRDTWERWAAVDALMGETLPSFVHSDLADDALFAADERLRVSFAFAYDRSPYRYDMAEYTPTEGGFGLTLRNLDRRGTAALHVGYDLSFSPVGAGRLIITTVPPDEDARVTVRHFPDVLAYGRKPQHAVTALQAAFLSQWFEAWLEKWMARIAHEMQMSAHAEDEE